MKNFHFGNTFPRTHCAFVKWRNACTVQWRSIVALVRAWCLCRYDVDVKLDSWSHSCTWVDSGKMLGRRFGCIFCVSLSSFLICIQCRRWLRCVIFCHLLLPCTAVMTLKFSFAYPFLCTLVMFPIMRAVASQVCVVIVVIIPDDGKVSSRKRRRHVQFFLQW